MSKGVFVVRVDNYLPDLCEVTLPAIEEWAKKIRASFTVITERKYPDLPPTYEKTQVWKLGRGNDWNILIDCDMAIRPEMYDVTVATMPGTIGAWMVYDPAITIAKDEILPLDGSGLALATNFMAVPQAFHDVWRHLDMESAELLSRMKRPFVVDEYCISRNIKQLGATISPLALPGAENNLFMHCNVTTDGVDYAKAVEMAREFML